MAEVDVDDKVALLECELEPREGADDPVALVKAYVSDDDQGHPRFTGRAFETFGVGGRDGNEPNRFTSDDLVALSLLGVPVSGAAALALTDEELTPLGDGRTWGDLLGAVRTDLTVTDAAGREQLLDTASAANDLWKAVKGLKGTEMGFTRTGKLLARKRPELLPIYDSVIETCVDPKASWWEIVASFFQKEANRDRVREVRDMAGAAKHLSVLRTLDVVLWMRHRGPTEG